MAAEPLSLMEFVHGLLADTGLRGRFADDPRATLHAYGLGDLSPADVQDALDLVQDNEIADFHGGAAAWDVDPEHDLEVPAHATAGPADAAVWQDPDAEAFGHGSEPAADHAGWSDPPSAVPDGGWPAWAADDGGPVPDDWADGFGAGLDGPGVVDDGPDPGPDAAPDHDAHHHG